MLLLGLHGKPLLGLQQAVQQLLAGVGHRAGVAEVVEGSNLAHLQDRSLDPVVSAGRLAHTWPPPLGHPTGQDILPLQASCSSDWSIPDQEHGGLPQAGVGESLGEETWLVVCHDSTALDVVLAGRKLTSTG